MDNSSKVLRGVTIVMVGPDTCKHCGLLAEQLRGAKRTATANFRQMMEKSKRRR
jgi:hypothetical protein